MAYQEQITRPTEFPIARGFVATRSGFIVIAMLGASLFTYLLGYQMSGAQDRNWATLVVHRIAAGAYIIPIFLALFAIINGFCLMVGPGLLLYSDGFELYGVRRRRIPWRDVDRIEGQPGFFHKISLRPHLFPSINVYLKEGVRSTLIQKMNRRMGFGEILIDHQCLQATTDEILEEMNSCHRGKPSEFSNYPREI